MEVILSRRSVREYKNADVSEKLIKEILEAGMHAPSARNEQPWHFLVVNDRNILKKIMEFHPYATMLAQAPAAILVLGGLETTPDEGYAVIDCAAATQNMLLAIHDKGLGAVWLGIYPRAERITGMRKLFSLPANVLPVSLIALGYPLEEKAQEARFNQARIHYNKW
ncbi:MAG: nitroreductase family protein [Planctomycetes bacterium]|nr:nitroreductase family protein [Planctomycetota bacterium]